jgi:hypothetical protein
MKIKLALTVLPFLMCGVALMAAPQDSTKTTHKKTRTVSGCLQAGDSGDEYKLTTAAGSTWEIKSDTVKLSDHVGHSVTITGVVSNATVHGMKEDAKSDVDKNATEHGHMTVTSLKMVSHSCKK